MVASGSTDRDRRGAAGAFAAAGHFAVWTGLYVGAAVACFQEGLLVGGVAGWRGWLGVGVGVCAGTAAYLLDRVKLRDAWLDEADRQAHRARYEFLYPRRRAVRSVIVLLALAGAAMAWVLHPLLSAAVAAAMAGVVVYAGVPRRAPLPPGARRVKDVLVVKNAAVAASIAALGGAVALAVAWGREGVDGREVLEAGRRWVWPAVFVFGHVLADSMLCDIDDAEADRRFGTQTLAWRVSERAVRVLAVALSLVLLAWTAAGLVLALDGRVGSLAGVRLAWAALMAAGSVALALVPRGRLRDAVDLRLPVVAAVALAAG